MLSRISVVVVTCVAAAMLCVAFLPLRHPDEPSALLELNGMVGGQVLAFPRTYP
jgi:hypothetical protein